MKSFLGIAVWLMLVPVLVADEDSSKEPPSTPPAKKQDSSEELPSPRSVEQEQEATLPRVPLDRFVAFAEARHPSLVAASAAIDEAHGMAIQAGLYPNPELQGGATQLGGVDNQLPVFLSQRIVTAGKLSLDQQAAVQEVFQAEHRFQLVHFEVLTGVRRNFYVALAAQQRVEILGQLTDLLSKSRDLAEKRREGGQGTRTDVVLLEIELRQTQATLKAARAKLVAQIRGLFASAGAPGFGDGVRLEGDLGVGIPFTDYDGLLQELAMSNSRLKIADLEVVRRQILLRRADVEPIPDVTVSAGYQRNTAPDETNNLGILTLSLPIPVWNRNQGGRIAAANAIHRAAAEAKNVRVSLGESLAEAWGRYRSATEQVVTIANEVLPVTKEGIELTRKGFQAGQADLLRLLAAQQGYVRAYLNYIDGQEQRWVGAADIAGLLQLKVFPPIPIGPVSQATEKAPLQASDEKQAAPEVPAQRAP